VYEPSASSLTVAHPEQSLCLSLIKYGIFILD